MERVENRFHRSDFIKTKLSHRKSTYQRTMLHSAQENPCLSPGRIPESHQQIWKAENEGFSLEEILNYTK